MIVFKFLYYLLIVALTNLFLVETDTVNTHLFITIKKPFIVVQKSGQLQISSKNLYLVRVFTIYVMQVFLHIFLNDKHRCSLLNISVSLSVKLAYSLKNGNAYC